MKSLEKQLEEMYDRLGVSEKNQGSINTYLSMLRLKDQATYEHSIRVGLLGVGVAEYADLDKKAMFFAGTLHDIGKIMIRPEVLKKSGKYTKKDIREMQQHPKYGYRLLSGVHDFSAEVALRHHKYQSMSYPKKNYKPKVHFSKDTMINLDLHAKMLAIVDFYDAINTRDNQKFGKKLSKEEAKRVLTKTYSEHKDLIEELYLNQVF
ncbi:HD domain-containing protein [Candidatus Woesearchaeota archaeon]|nr:HD domain-containing protein [Candidatus Woesearchaeota archaeon]